VDLGGLQRLIQAHGRQNGRESPRQHGLSRSGRADQENVVTAGGGNLERALGGGLAPHIRKVGLVRRGAGYQGGDVGACGLNCLLAGEMGAGLQQCASAADLEPFYHRCLGDVGLREEYAAIACCPRRKRHGKRAAHGTEVAFQADFADDHLVAQSFIGELAAGRENAERDGKIEGGAVFPDIGRREIHRDATKGEGKTGIGQRGAHSLSAFLHRTLRQADGGERWQPVRDVHLDIHRVGVDAEDGGRTDSREHGVV
jgi:hypothetical protein